MQIAIDSVKTLVIDLRPVFQQPLYPQLNKICPQFQGFSDKNEVHLSKSVTCQHLNVMFGDCRLRLIVTYSNSHVNSSLQCSFMARVAVQSLTVNVTSRRLLTWIYSQMTSAEPELLSVLNDKSAEVDSTSSNFWVMVAALKVRDCPH